MCVEEEKSRDFPKDHSVIILREREKEEQRQDNRSFGLQLFRPNGKS